MAIVRQIIPLLITLVGLAIWIALAPVADVIRVMLELLGAVVICGAFCCIPFMIVHAVTRGQ